MYKSSVSTLVMRISLDRVDNTDSNVAICKAFAKQFGSDIEDFANVDYRTEHNIENFGPGSAWITEAEISFQFLHEENEITLTLTKTA